TGHLLFGWSAGSSLPAAGYETPGEPVRGCAICIWSRVHAVRHFTPPFDLTVIFKVASSPLWNHPWFSPSVVDRRLASPTTPLGTTWILRLGTPSPGSAKYQLLARTCRHF